MYAKTQLLIRQARIIDPSSQRDEVADLLIEEGRISRIGASLDGRGADIINAEGLWLLPGLVDTCVHLPEPGHHRAGTIASETQAAAAGGITHVCAPPDTDPVADSTAVIRLIRERAAQTALARVLPLAALTQGLEGLQLAEMQTLKEAGCIGVSNAGQPVANSLVLKRGLEYASTFDIPVMFRPQDASLSQGGCAHDGPVATRLGLPSIPAVAESLDMARILHLVEHTGVRAHFYQLSSADSVALLRSAKAKGLPITADVCVHHLLLDETAVEDFNSDCRIDPPLRSQADRKALVAAVADGTIDAISSQHKSLGSSAKLAPFPSTKPGISGLETLLPLVLKLVNAGELPLTRAIDALTRAPAVCLGINAGHLEAGRRANICLIDPNQQRLPRDKWQSAGRNSPWIDTHLPSKQVLTITDGRITWDATTP